MCTCQDFADFVSQSVPHHRITTPFMVMGVDLGGGGGVCLSLSKLLITRRKSKNYTSSLKYSGPCS